MKIARLLFPGLQPEPKGGWNDIAGIDATDRDARKVQIKFDGAIKENIYHEVYEKTENHPEQPWRPAFGKVDDYIFTGENPTEWFAIRVQVGILAEVEKGKRLTPIRPNGGANTSMGFLVPLTELRGKYERKAYPKNKRKD